MGKRRNGRTKAPWEKPYVHTDEQDGGKYIDPDEYLNLQPIRKQREKLPRIVRSRPGAAQDRWSNRLTKSGLVSNAATASLLLLLALTGGFLFTYRWRPTYYISRREEGQRLLFVAACAAFPLLLVSSGSLWVANRYLPSSFTGAVGDVGGVLVEPYVGEPFNASTFAPFVGALVWGWILPRLLNIYYGPERASNIIIDTYAGELEKLMYRAMGEFLLVSITLKSRKVYVGWPVRALIPNPRRGDIRPHIRLLPAISGYRREDTQELVFTTDYSPVYQRIEEEAVPGQNPEERLSADDLEMVIPVDEIVSANLFSTNIDQDWFEMPTDVQADTQPGR